MAKILTVVDMNKCIGCYSCMLACARTVRRSFSPSRAALQMRTAGGFQSKFVAEICRGCDHAPCSQACNCGALVVREGGGVRYYANKCIGCRDCVDACIINVLYFDDEKKQPIVCIQCGTCVEFCPHNVLAMEVKEHE